jgi:L-threonylcarbamoyladenylate synthase
MHQTFDCATGIAKCASIVKSGGVVVFPTDTIYGIGCDPYNDAAVARIFAIKGRDEGKPLPVLAYSIQDAEKIAALGTTGRALANKFWPGALTLVAPVADRKISARVRAGTNSVAVRVPGNKCVLSLLRECKYLVGTSANVSGGRPSKNAAEIAESGLTGFDALLDGGAVEKGIESTIVDVTEKPRVLREGAIKPGEIYRVVEK